MSAGTAAQVADIYARSLLDLADQSQAVEPVSADLDAVSTLMTQNPDFHAFLASPYFGEQTKHDLARKAFTGKLHRLTLNFLLVTIEHDRAMLLPEILDRYRQLYRMYQGYRTVNVTVAQSMSPEQRQTLSRELAEAMNTKIDLDVHVDPAILGGVILRYGDKMLDNSVRGRLTRTVNQLLDAQKRHK